MRGRSLVLVLALGCSAAPATDWDRLALEARALRPAIPAGDAAILDALEARARTLLTGLRHPADREGWEEAVPRIRGALRASLGLADLPSPEPRKLRAVGVLARDGYRLEKLVYETLPGVDVPAHLYLPASPPGKIPGILFVPGHWYA